MSNTSQEKCGDMMYRANQNPSSNCSMVLPDLKKCSPHTSLVVEVLEVITDHSRPAVKGKVAQPKLNFFGAMFRNLRPNQLKYPFEKKIVPFLDLRPLHILMLPLWDQSPMSSSRPKIKIAAFYMD